MLRSVCFALLCITLLSFSGCGGSGDVTVSGTLGQNGQIYKPEPSEQVMIVFGEEKDGKLTGKSFTTRLAADGSYKIIGPDNKGIPPGKYRVGIMSNPEVPVPGQKIEEKFQGAFAPATSPIVVEVSSAKSTVPLEIP